MQALQNAIDLRFAVSDVVGNRAISDVFPRLITMAEEDLNARLRTRFQIAEDVLFFDEGVSSLPPDFIELASPLCKPFAVDGFNVTAPGYAGELPIQYYSKLPSLTSAPTASNWLLAKFPSVYLYGVALQAAKHLRDVDLAQATDQLYGFAIGNLIKADERARWSGQTVRVRGMTP